jgi:Ca-activated chloride channel homolog
MAFLERPRRCRTSWPLLLCLLAFFSVSASRASQENSSGAQPSIESASDLVAVDVSVLDSKGDFYGGLERNDFRVLDNGVQKPLLFFTPVDAPAHVVILVETGPAVYLIHEQHIEALSALLDGLAPDDQAALYTYSDSLRQVLAFTADKSALRNSIGEPEYTVGMDQLNFYDSLSAVIDRLPAGPEKKAVVVLATGLDSSIPPGHWEALERKLRGDDVVIFPVALGGSLRGGSPANGKKKPKKKAATPSAAPDSETAFERADQALARLAEITGGKVYFPQTPADFVPAYREIAEAVRHQYVLGIAPDHDGAFHKLSVEILDLHGRPPKPGTKKPPYRALYREGYSAPAP